LFTSGALTVVIYEAGKEMLGRFMPGLPMGAYIEEDMLDGVGYYGAGYNPADEEAEVGSLGYYESEGMDGMGISLEEELDIG